MSQPPSIIYSGFNNIVTFTLPSGNVSDNYSVAVSISITDAIGASTNLCSMDIAVVPAASTSTTDDHGTVEVELWVNSYICKSCE